jgi:hypothetical protein
MLERSITVHRYSYTLPTIQGVVKVGLILHPNGKDIENNPGILFYEIIDEQLIILILKIASRGNAYQD